MIRLISEAINFWNDQLIFTMFLLVIKYNVCQIFTVHALSYLLSKSNWNFVHLWTTYVSIIEQKLILLSIALSKIFLWWSNFLTGIRFIKEKVLIEASVSVITVILLYFEPSFLWWHECCSNEKYQFLWLRKDFVDLRKGL